MDEYEERKVDLPIVSFAVKNFIKGFKEKSNKLHDPLRAIEDLLSPAKADEAVQTIYSSLSNKPIASDETLYFSRINLNGKDNKVYLTEDEVRRTDTRFDINPLIYYRIAANNHHIVNRLPQIQLKDFYDVIGGNNNIQIKVKKVMMQSNKLDYQELLKNVDEETRDRFTTLGDFTEEMDSELIREMDKFYRNNPNIN